MPANEADLYNGRKMVVVVVVVVRISPQDLPSTQSMCRMDRSDTDAVCRHSQTQLSMLTDQTAFDRCSEYISNTTNRDITNMAGMSNTLLYPDKSSHLVLTTLSHASRQA